MSTAVQPLTTIGHVTPRVDASARVTGQAKYTNDLKLPGMLYARVLRSPHPHARIRHIDASAASRLPGVQAVITHENAQVVWGAGAVAGGRQYSDAIKEITRQRRSIFNNPVRCVGDAVAAVAATDRHIAEQALALDRKSTRLNSSHLGISYAVFCLKNTRLPISGGAPPWPPLVNVRALSPS